MNGSYDRQQSQDGRAPRSASAAPTSGSGRAEKYENEKRRIIESCFSKMDTNGALSESYITHLRVTEDAAYPQSPPPPTSNPNNKKPRVIIVAVRSSGRVRVHKARENSNGTFSIGKTWNMEDLTAIESFANAMPKNPEEAQRKDWAGPTGFIVTLAKPYYWQANSPKEKDFFINSLVKIYGKYTSGKVPRMLGFTQRELDLMARPPAKPAAPSSQSVPPAPIPQAPSSPSSRPPPSRSAESPGRVVAAPPRDRSRDSPRRRPVAAGRESSEARRRDPSQDSAEPGLPPPLQPRSRPGTSDDRASSQSRPPPSRSGETAPGVPPSWEARQLRSQASGERVATRGASGDQMRPRPSQEQFRPSPGPPPSLSSSARLTPQSSQSEFSQMQSSPDPPPTRPQISIPVQSPARRGFPKAPLDPYSKSTTPIDPPPKSPAKKSFDSSLGAYGSPAESAVPSPSKLGLNGNRRDPTPQGLRPGTSQSNLSRKDEAADELLKAPPPERKRPPILPAVSTGSTADAPPKSPRFGDVPPPLKSPRAPPSPIVKPSPVLAPQAMPGSFMPSDTEKSTPELMAKQSIPEMPPAKIEPEEPKAEETTPQQELSPEAAPSAEPSLESPQRKSDDSEEPKPAGGNILMKKKLASAGSDGKPKMADVLRRAANAYGAFKPRAGGAAEKFKAALADAPSEQKPDGITGVFNAPSLNRTGTDDSIRAETPKSGEPEAKDDVKSPDQDMSSPSPAQIPELQISAPNAAAKAYQESDSRRAPSPDTKRGKSPEDLRRARRRSNQQAKYLTSLGVDVGVLDNRGLEVESILSDFGWGSTGLQPKKLEAFEAELKREVARVEAGAWLSNQDTDYDKVEVVATMMDRVIAECDELEGLLTLYNVELSSLNDDIAFIEAQSQGLQVQTANQKILQAELEKLVSTISIDKRQLEPLRGAGIGKAEGLEAIERALLLLYKAMVTIDPAIRRGVEIGEKMGGMGDSELSNMRALQEKKQSYIQESAFFLQRLRQHMDMTFGAALLNTKDAIQRQSAGHSTKLDPATHDFARNALWQYSPLMLFAKEIDGQTWDALLRSYQERSKPIYKDEFRGNMAAWTRMARKITGDEQDLLFTSQEKDAETLKSTTRKLTVKRSGTLARGLRSSSGEKTKNMSGTLFPFEAFSGALDEMCPLVFTEQNFVVEFFHATSSENVDFADAVNATPPYQRKGSNLLARRMFEPDRAMAKRVIESMESIFGWWQGELQSSADGVVGSDPLQGVGILASLDRKLIELEETNQDFLTKVMQGLQGRISTQFQRFVETQIAAIEDTKVKIKKRKGVIAFIKTFPHFSAAIENMLPAADDPERLEVRGLIDEAYQKINKAMFESLKVIAKESPTAMAAQVPGVSGVGADPEDKEALNYHILHIENMNHYIEEVDERGDIVLGEWKERAQGEMNEHMSLYVDAVIRRPLGKLLDFLTPIPGLLRAMPSGTPQSALAGRPSHSRSVWKKMVASYDSKEIRKGIEALRKRVEKHFGDADDLGISRGLVTKVLGECEKKYQDVWQNVIEVNNTIYGGDVDVGTWGDEIGGSFRGSK
ncbi:exocyst complex component Sec3-domain-containing protein [Phyllosticta citrichinensis]|uniref:Exocyst complex component Sec3-domain-containing protein n=1 Tax=Phyllosticta citrichinensis TaxID=1130410 RepID=A0ABR1Y071_9PEZI